MGSGRRRPSASAQASGVAPRPHRPRPAHTPTLMIRHLNSARALTPVLNLGAQSVKVKRVQKALKAKRNDWKVTNETIATLAKLNGDDPKGKGQAAIFIIGASG